MMSSSVTRSKLSVMRSSVMGSKVSVMCDG